MMERRVAKLAGVQGVYIFAKSNCFNLDRLKTRSLSNKIQSPKTQQK
jgi:hypothetical protein